MRITIHTRLVIGTQLKIKGEDYMKFVEFEDIKKLDIGYIFIPERIILDDCGLVNTEVLLYTYLSMNQTMRKKILFSGYDFCKWLNVSYSKRDGEILDRVEKSFKRLLELDTVKCFSLHEKFGRNGFYEVELQDEIKPTEKFGILYLDEIEKIMSREINRIGRTSYFGMAIRLLAYFRLNIFVRSNEFNADNADKDSEMDKRRMDSPEAFYKHIKYIALDLNLHRDTIQKFIDILVDLQLIVKRTPYKFRCENNWYCPECLFANAYKRQNGYLIASGEEYYNPEFDAAEKRLKKSRNYIFLTYKKD